MRVTPKADVSAVKLPEDAVESVYIMVFVVTPVLIASICELIFATYSSTNFTVSGMIKPKIK